MSRTYNGSGGLDDLEAGTRKCRDCGEWKLLEGFVLDCRSYLGHTYWCKLCRARYNRNCNSVDSPSHDKQKQRMREYARKNRELIAEGSRCYEARLSGAPADLPAVMLAHIRRLYKDGKGKCYYCRRRFDYVARHDPNPHPHLGDWQRDHIVPRKVGGGYTRDNIVLACWRCNQKKRDKTPLEAGLALL